MATSDDHIWPTDVNSHATNLSERVQQLEHILSESQFGSEDAVKAARAYKDIVAAVNSAREAADSAENDTNNAVKILNNVQERTNDAEEKSGNVLDFAHESNQSTYRNLEPKLRAAISTYVPVKETHDKNDQLLKDIEKILDNIQVQDLSTAYRSAVGNAEEAFSSVEVVEALVNSTFAKYKMTIAKFVRYAQCERQVFFTTAPARVGHNAKLTIREELENGTEQATKSQSCGKMFGGALTAKRGISGGGARGSGGSDQQISRGVQRRFTPI
ncbi:hypothetical protein NQ318_003218 [Aromia moschata]|uniref:Uncharacterized protein n=1 Tax=Aromia moschata TaxID=1265417 RepID=A0AAV8YQD4_9CUCU|nr:hypothetical protein NQ318_003218 [Aromia moschata]